MQIYLPQYSSKWESLEIDAREPTIWYKRCSALLSDKKQALATLAHWRSYGRAEASSRIWQLTVTTWTGYQAWENRDQSQDE